MGSLYSLSPVCMNYRQTARKPARQQVHEALSLVEAGGCDLYSYACVCMLIYVQACVLYMGLFVVWCGCEEIGDDAQVLVCSCIRELSSELEYDDIDLMATSNCLIQLNIYSRTEFKRVFAGPPHCMSITQPYAGLDD